MTRFPGFQDAKQPSVPGARQLTLLVFVPGICRSCDVPVQFFFFPANFFFNALLIYSLPGGCVCASMRVCVQISIYDRRRRVADTAADELCHFLLVTSQIIPIL